MKLTINDNSYISSLVAQVDKYADTVRLRVAGDSAKAKEYAVAQAEAETFRDAGFTGLAGSFVNSWAIAKGWTQRQAAEDILDAATRANDSLDTIRALRLKAKEDIKVSKSKVAADAIYSEYQTAMSVIGK